MSGRAGFVVVVGLTVALAAIVLIPAHAHAPRVLIGFVLGAATFLAADGAGRRAARRPTHRDKE